MLILIIVIFVIVIIIAAILAWIYLSKKKTIQEQLTKCNFDLGNENIINTEISNSISAYEGEKDVNINNLAEITKEYSATIDEYYDTLINNSKILNHAYLKDLITLSDTKEDFINSVHTVLSANYNNTRLGLDSLEEEVKVCNNELDQSIANNKNLLEEKQHFITVINNIKKAIVTEESKLGYIKKQMGLIVQYLILM